MKKIVLIVALLLSGSVTVYAEDSRNISQAIRDVVVANLEATEGEDMNGMMATIHSRSPGYTATKQRMTQLFQNYDLDYELIRFRFVGVDGEYAVGRTIQKTTKVSGGTFRNNEVDMIQVFKKEGGQWKFWNQVLLEVAYIE